jgi:hypothetical protein
MTDTTVSLPPEGHIDPQPLRQQFRDWLETRPDPHVLVLLEVLQVDLRRRASFEAAAGVKAAAEALRREMTGLPLEAGS